MGCRSGAVVQSTCPLTWRSTGRAGTRPLIGQHQRGPPVSLSVRAQAANQRMRQWIAPAALGLIAPHLLVGLWGVFVASVWIPLWRWAWTTHQIKKRELAIDPAPYFDALVGLLVGASVAYLLLLVTRGPIWRAWLLFGAAFLISVLAASLPIDWDMIWFAVQPVIVEFFVGAAIV